MLWEALLVLAVGIGLSLAANWLSPQGLSLTADPFHGDTRPTLPLASTNALTNVVAMGTNTLSLAEQVAVRLKEKGLQVATSNEVLEVFRDPRYPHDLVVIVDARDEDNFKQGHIPGAVLFNHYYLEKHLPVLQLCQIAEKIVVYCSGGDCDDSEHAAVTLRETGVSKEKLWVYPGGMAEWSTNGLPVEIGDRRSGVLQGAKP
ncbi:MAG: hypothetical protein HZA90_16540 [Verrucomicrobia bacterium]|nr:hypothetical protein [Verrucomicrobiota bacterium]